MPLPSSYGAQHGKTMFDLAIGWRKFSKAHFHMDFGHCTGDYDLGNSLSLQLDHETKEGRHHTHM